LGGKNEEIVTYTGPKHWPKKTPQSKNNVSITLSWSFLFLPSDWRSRAITIFFFDTYQCYFPKVGFGLGYSGSYLLVFSWSLRMRFQNSCASLRQKVDPETCWRIRWSKGAAAGCKLQALSLMINFSWCWKNVRPR
jgi:hypothetical protein